MAKIFIVYHSQTGHTEQMAQAVFEGARVVDVEHPAMGGEDFSFFAREVPSTFLWLGCRPAHADPAIFAPVHNNCFTPDEACFRYGVEALVRSALAIVNDETGR